MNRVDEMRDALLASPDFREEAFACEGTKEISAASDEDLPSVRLKVMTRHLDTLVETALSQDCKRLRQFAEMTEVDVLEKECKKWGINPLSPTQGAS